MHSHHMKPQDTEDVTSSLLVLQYLYLKIPVLVFVRGQGINNSPHQHLWQCHYQHISTVQYLWNLFNRGGEFFLKEYVFTSVEDSASLCFEMSDVFLWLNVLRCI